MCALQLTERDTGYEDTSHEEICEANSESVLQWPEIETRKVKNGEKIACEVLRCLDCVQVVCWFGLSVAGSSI